MTDHPSHLLQPHTFQGTSSGKMQEDRERVAHHLCFLLSFLTLVFFSFLAIQSTVISRPVGLQSEARQNYMLLLKLDR